MHAPIRGRSSFDKDVLTNEHEWVLHVVVAHVDNGGAHPTTETLHDVLGAACTRFKPCPLSRRRYGTISECKSGSVSDQR